MTDERTDAITYTIDDVNTIIDNIKVFNNLAGVILNNDELKEYKRDFTIKTLNHISDYDRKQYTQIEENGKTKRINYVYISNYAEKYLNKKSEIDDLQKLIKELINEKVKLKDKDIMDSKLPEQFLYVYVKSTNLKSFQDRFLLMPSYIGWKSDRPTIRHFVLPNETALTKDEFINKNVEIANDELIDLYKVKVLLEEYIYKHNEYDKIKIENKLLKNIINEQKKYTFTSMSNYENILNMFKVQIKKNVIDYLRIHTHIAKSDFIKRAKMILDNLLRYERGDKPKFIKTEFVINIDSEERLKQQLEQKISDKDVANYISKLDEMLENPDNNSIRRIKRMMKFYNDIVNKPLFLAKVEEILTKLEKTPSVEEFQKQIKQLKQTREEVYNEIKKILNSEMSISDIENVFENLNRIPYTRIKEIMDLLDIKIIEMRENAKTPNEKLKYTEYIKKSLNVRETFKYEPFGMEVEESGEFKEQIILNTDLKEKLKKGNNPMIIRKIIENMNKYIVGQTINKKLNFNYDVDNIMKIQNIEANIKPIEFILDTIIDINIQMRKINSIASKGQNIRIMLFKDVVELLLNKIIKGRKLMATRDFYFIIKDVKWTPKERKNLNSEEQLKIGLDKKAFEIEISLVLSIEGRSDTSLAFERKCNENEQAIGQIWNEFYGGLKNAVNTGLDKLEEKRRKVEEIDCKNIADLSIQGMKECLIKSKKSQPLDMYYEFSIPKIYGRMPAKMPENKSIFTGIEVEFPIRNTLVYDE